MFEVGDHIIYPMHGAGIIEEIEDKEVLGEIRRYYVINIPVDNMQVMIPVNRVEKSHIRAITDKLVLKSVLEVFRNGKTDQTLSWKDRFKMNTEKVKNGKLKDVAEVVRDLKRIHEIKPLNSSEKQLFESAKKLLIGEVSLVNGISNVQATELLRTNFS
ncbi:CarD family transcriptional regulator [Bacillus massilinigeriensis]|uniref:CarD family transcriptional regulator n=1 Tax=Bacillus mediterraneensis TaxID=1805474 RepID=UPI0008F809CB|nr:CarD family transcriptional regulator [Bacillus mediterraneensis]